MDHFSSLIKKVRIIYTKEELFSLVDELLSSKKPLVISFLNAHAITLAQKNNDFYRDLKGSDILLRDGVGIAIAMKALGRPAGMNMNGTDFIPILLATAKRRRIAVFGTQSPWLEIAADKLSVQHEIVGKCDGFQPDHHYIELCRAERPEIVLLGMGMPKQERVAIPLRDCATGSLLIINGGAILDFISSRFKRAPQWIQHCHAEWIFRVLQEPRRLLHRYTVGIVKFFYYLIRCKFRK